MGIIAYCNMLLSAEKGISALQKIFPIQNDPNGILRLLKGFTYSIISEKGQMMSDGLTVPDHADGMASFKGKNNNIILIRNHEIGHFSIVEKLLDKNPFYKNKDYLSKNKSLIYDNGRDKIPCCGGTTTIVYNPKTKKVETEYMSLAGTLVNCSGGPTPWGTWITCEETVEKKGGNLLRNHGYNFEVHPNEKIKLNEAVALKDMGRFRHEAIAIDPNTHIAYQTEDRDDGLIYRFIPNTKQQYKRGGKLQTLIINDIQKADTRNWNNQIFEVGSKYKINWIDLDGINSPEDDLRYRGVNKGAAYFARPEGMWYDDDIIYFTCTTGGSKKLGQIWKINIKQQILELMFESHNSSIMKKCDNITIAPWGDVIICEDGRGKDRLIGLKKTGETYIIAENILNSSEFAGANFSPDGNILFVNIYSPTMTIAITGPWNKII